MLFIIDLVDLLAGPLPMDFSLIAVEFGRANIRVLKLLAWFKFITPKTYNLSKE